MDTIKEQNVWLKGLPNKHIPLAVVACYDGNYLELYLAKYCVENKIWKEFNSQYPIFHVTHYLVIQHIHESRAKRLLNSPAK